MPGRKSPPREARAPARRREESTAGWRRWRPSPPPVREEASRIEGSPLAALDRGCGRLLAPPARARILEEYAVGLESVDAPDQARAFVLGPDLRSARPRLERASCKATRQSSTTDGSFSRSALSRSCLISWTLSSPMRASVHSSALPRLKASRAFIEPSRGRYKPLPGQARHAPHAPIWPSISGRR